MSPLLVVLNLQVEQQAVRRIPASCCLPDAPEQGDPYPLAEGLLCGLTD
jgi:hypothetical protein